MNIINKTSKKQEKRKDMTEYGFWGIRGSFKQYKNDRV